MWSVNNELIHPAGFKTEPAKKDMSFNSSQFSQAITKELEYLNEKDQIISCKSEALVKHEVIVKQGDGDQLLSH